MKPIRHILLLITFLSTSVVIAQFNFEAKINKQTIGLDETVRVDFEMNRDADSFDAPDFNDFEVVSGPTKNIHTSWINGERTFKKVISYNIIPKKQGDLVIDAARIKFDEETYLTESLIVQVDSDRTDHEDNSYVLEFDDGVHLVAEMSNTQLSLGETTEVTYKLYVSYDIGITNWKELEKPQFEDFNSEAIDIGSIEVSKGKYKGKSYRYVILSKTKLTSKKKGEFEFMPLKLSVTVEIPSDKKDVFGSTVMTTVSKIIKSEPVAVIVN